MLVGLSAVAMNQYEVEDVSGQTLHEVEDNSKPVQPPCRVRQRRHVVIDRLHRLL